MRRKLILAAGAVLALSAAADAAGVDSRSYTCTALQSMIVARGFVFISQPAFGDFVVADVRYCSGGGAVQRRSVATADNPECLVNYCIEPHREGRVD